MEPVFHDLRQLCSGGIICLLVVPCRALKLPLFRHEGKKQSERRSEEEAPDPAYADPAAAAGAGMVTAGRVISEGVEFLPFSWSPQGEAPHRAALAASKPQLSPVTGAQAGGQVGA